MKKRMISLILALSMICALFPVVVFAQTSGTCGSNLTWTLDDNGTLTISGTGDMENWGYPNPSGAPWKSKSIKDIVIENGVTSIGNRAFYDCSSLTSITIPNSVTSIGNDAFEWCSSLTSITIPNSVTSIGNHAFDGCSSLTNITIPSSVTSIGNRAFYDCSSLTSIAIPKGVTSIGDYAFESCSSLTSITIPNSVTSISWGMFWGCSSLTNVTIPNGVTSIGNYAFRDCSNLTSVIIPDSVTSIGWGEFYSCNNLKDVYYSGNEEQWKSINIGRDNEALTRATIHYNSSIPTGTKGNTNSTSSGAPIIKSVKLTHDGNTYDIFNKDVTIEADSEITASIEAEVDNNGCNDVKVYVTSGAGKEIDITGGSKKFKPGKELSAGATIYIMAVDKTTGKSTAKATKLKVSSTASGSVGAGSGVDGLNFKLGKDVGFTIPDSVPVFGGTDIKWSFDFIPVTFEYDKEDDNKLNVVIGGNVMSEEYEKNGVKRKYFKNFDFKKYKKDISHAARTQKHDLKDLRSYFDKDKGKKKNMNLFGGNVSGSGSGSAGGDFDFMGYAEMKYIDGQWKFVEGVVKLDAEVKYTYEGQVFIWVVPCYYEFGGGAGAGFEGKMINLSADTFTPQFEGYLSAKIMAEIGGGVGVSGVATAGANGEGSLNIKTALAKKYIKSWGEGSASFNVKLFGKTVVEKEFARGDFLIYETGNKKGLIKDNSISLQSEKNTDNMYSIDVNQVYENESRAYAENPTEWLGEDEQINLMSDYTNKNLFKIADNVYTESKPQICEVDGKKVMVMQWDNSERSDSDRSMLVYSVYDDVNEKWSAPKAVADDGTADFYPCFNDGYLVWQNEKTVLDDNMTLTDIAKLGEICVSKWNGNGFDTPTAITDNSTLDTMPYVAKTSDGASIVWVTNTENDILGVSGKNTIMQSDFNGSSWSAAKSIKTGINAITNMTAGYVNDKFCVAYVSDDDNDLDTINDRDIRIIADGALSQLTNNDVLDSNPIFVNDKIYYYSNGNIVYSDIDGANAGTVFDETKAGLTDTFVADSNADGDVAVWWTKAENGGAEVYASLYTNDEWSDEIKVTSVGNRAKYPNGILNDDGSMLVAFNNAVEQDNVITKTDLYTISVNPSYDLELTDVYFNEVDMKAFATVKNNGELNVESYTVTLAGNQKNITEPLKAGESAEVEIEYVKPNDFSPRNIELSVSTTVGDEYNINNNSVEISVGHADIDVDNVTENAEEKNVSTDVSNIGYDDANNVKVCLRDGSADGKVIDEKTINLAVGESKNVSFDIDKNNMSFFTSSKTLYVTAEYDGAEVSLGNNDAYVVITSNTGDADYEVEILNYNGIDNKYVINSVARNNTDEKLTSCLLYSAVYSSDGTLKGCNTVKTDIGANDDTGVDITVSCDIETGDTIKTFMWNNDMSALAEIADLVVE